MGEETREHQDHSKRRFLPAGRRKAGFAFIGAWRFKISCITDAWLAESSGRCAEDLRILVGGVPLESRSRCGSDLGCVCWLVSHHIRGEPSISNASRLVEKGTRRRWAGRKQLPPSRQVTRTCCSLSQRRARAKAGLQESLTVLPSSPRRIRCRWEWLMSTHPKTRPECTADFQAERYEFHEQTPPCTRKGEESRKESSSNNIPDVVSREARHGRVIKQSNSSLESEQQSCGRTLHPMTGSR